MRAIRQHAFGGPDELRLEDVPDPRPGSGQVRIRVESAGVHVIDTAIRRGQQTGVFALPELPMTPGREVAGMIDELGDGVDPGWLGRRVVAHLGMASGGYAELAVAAVDALHEIPGSLDAHGAVAMIGTGRTMMAILEVAEPTAADVVLITAAAGGIGSLLVQAARNAGATAVGVAGGAKKAALAGELGATVAFDYTQPGWTGAVRDALDGREITLAFDGVGGDIGGAFELLGIGGRLILYGWSSGTPLTV
ncbi:MAG: zinc-binding dehydrogenase, partial [Nitriliruptorales bacterium]|nr:zinc-binding dehydrogenase [Nitriliruptorales bacterium]